MRRLRRKRGQWLGVALVSIACSGGTVQPQAPEPTPSGLGTPPAPHRTPPAALLPSRTAPTPSETGATGAELTPPKGTAELSFALGPARVSLGPEPPWTGAAAEPEPGAPTAKSPGRWWRPVRTIWVGKGYLYRAEFNREGSSVFTLSQEDGLFRHYDVASGRLVREVPLQNFERFDAVDFAVKDDRYVILTRDQGAFLLDLETGKQEPLAPAFAGDTVKAEPIAGLFSFSARKIEPQSGVVTLAWMRPGQEPRLAATLECSERPDAVALSPDGRTLAVHFYPSNETHVANLETGATIATLPAPKWGGALALSPDGKLLALGGEALHLHGLPSGELLDVATAFGNNIGNVRFTPAGDLLLVAAFDGKARSYALGDPTSKLPAPQLLRHRGSANVYGLGVSADGRRLATSSGDRTLRIWER